MSASATVPHNPARPVAKVGAAAEAMAMIRPFLAWAEQSGLKSYDWWDLWGFPFGRWAKTQYVHGNILGHGAVGLLTAADLVVPGIRRFFVEERSFPICHAHMGLGYVNLWRGTGDRQWLRKAVDLADPLLTMASPAAHGLGWGMKHEWTTVRGNIPADTPCNTQTAYAYEFFCELERETGHPRYADALASIAAHVAHDFREWRENDRLACSYSTIDHARVINANSYRMMMLLEAGRRFRNDEYREKGMATLRYILAMQRPDGSWPYAEDQDFVDTYHTCFVLKNLNKADAIIGSVHETLRGAIDRGLSYLLANHFDENDRPIPFSVAPRITLYRHDAYDLAESIGFLSTVPGQEDRVGRLVTFAHKFFQTSEGWFKFRLYPGNTIKGIPYMRYANSAMFLALSSLCQDVHEG